MADSAVSAVPLGGANPFEAEYVGGVGRVVRSALMQCWHVRFEDCRLSRAFPVQPGRPPAHRRHPRHMGVRILKTTPVTVLPEPLSVVSGYPTSTLRLAMSAFITTQYTDEPRFIERAPDRTAEGFGTARLSTMRPGGGNHHIGEALGDP